MNYFTVDEYFDGFRKKLGNSLYNNISEGLKNLSDESIDDIIVSSVDHQNALKLFGASGCKLSIGIDDLNVSKSLLHFFHSIEFIAPYYTKVYMSGFILTNKGNEYYRQFKTKYGKTN